MVWNHFVCPGVRLKEVIKRYNLLMKRLKVEQNIEGCKTQPQTSPEPLPFPHDMSAICLCLWQMTVPQVSNS